MTEEIRDYLRADLHGRCPYGEPPEIVSNDGTEPDAAKGNWLINGKPRDVMSPECAWIVTTPKACDDCALNPHNRREPSARLMHLFRIESLQSAGAVFTLNQLTPREWQGLAILKVERQRREQSVEH